MAEVICMPKLGFNMDEGQLVRWCKAVGEEIKKGEVLFEINTDKTTMPVEATADGVLLKTMLEENEFAEVFTPIAVVGEAGEDADAALAAYGDGQDAGQDGQAAAAAVDVKALKLTPKARKLIKDEGIDLASLKGITGTGFQGGITAKDIKASPLARKIAEKTGIDLSAVTGTGVNGKIMKADVQAAAGAVQTAAPADTEEKKVLSSVPYKGVRKIIGDKLAESKFTAPHLYFTDAVDTANMTAFREQMNEVSDRRITVSDLLVYAASKALQKFPGINTSLVDGNIVTYKSTNIGVAVAGDNGLIVPVIKNVQEKTLTAISEENRDLVDRAKEGRLAPAEYSGGTFSISNLGMFGIGNFTAIINPPEAAILSVSSVRKMPVVIEEDGEDKIVIRPMMNIQLSVDHRLIDGLLASQFVEYMKELLENPLKILL
ncbi:MAG: 2-oxo acid dehydrogenase subunit E2 [Eubacterium sp.]|nr:2-oxo acid dehydrogenase subunit E2 [Eubacterium sp.]